MQTTTGRFQLNYESLVENYETGLSTQLRNFKSGPEFLETWVHDTDPRRSVLGIFEAAREAGVEELKLDLGPNSIDKLNVSSLGDELRELGQVRITTTVDGAHITVSFG